MAGSTPVVPAYRQRRNHDGACAENDIASPAGEGERERAGGRGRRGEDEGKRAGGRGWRGGGASVHDIGSNGRHIVNVRTSADKRTLRALNLVLCK
jgi:hypothetical protein